MVSVAVLQVGVTELIFDNPGVKVKGQYYCNVSLSQQMLPAIKRVAKRCLFTRQYVAYGEIGHSLCSVISQGKVVALDRWGGKWNYLSMLHRLTTNCAKNYCNRTLIVKVIVENVVTCFFGTRCSSGAGWDPCCWSQINLAALFCMYSLKTRDDFDGPPHLAGRLLQ